MAAAGRPSKRQQVRQERRQQILDAALRVFSQKGFHAANVSDVAAEAGVSQGTIYWYFGSKDELLTAAMLSFFDHFGKDAAAALDECPPGSEKLRALAGTMATFTKAAEGLFSLFLEYYASSPRREESAQLWTGVLNEYKDLVVETIEEGARYGVFKTVDAEQLAWALMAAYDGLAAYSVLMPELDLTAISRALVETLLSGLELARGGYLEENQQICLPG